ncbi:MAG: hypothetical protein HW387_1669 [Parachlamydiales bacterium]|nr:hypothetical protein [Parachlamydiales bacterium]
MKKLSLGKKLLLAGSILTLAVACQSKPVRQPTQPSQSLHSDIDGACEDEDNEESTWDQTEPFKTEEKQLKAVAAPAPAEPVKPEAPKATVAAPVEQPAAPVAATPAPAVPAAPVVEVPAPAAPAPVAETKAPEAPAAIHVEQQIATPVPVSTPAAALPEKSAVSENSTPANTAP